MAELTPEHIERLRTDGHYRMTSEDWFSLCDMALASLRAREAAIDACLEILYEYAPASSNRGVVRAIDRMRALSSRAVSEPE